MIPILTKEQAYQLDKSTINSGYMTEEELMDNAGFSIACHILENSPNPFNIKIAIICGKGNNGGDGIIAHHYLSQWNCHSELILIDEKIKSSKIISNYEIAENEITIYNKQFDFSKYDLILDGILGIGNSRKLDDKLTEIIGKINLSENVIAIDIPSGLIANNGIMKDSSITARQTFAMGFPKLAHFINDGIFLTGDLQIHDIGLPEFEPVIFSLIEESDIRENINLSFPTVHKFSKGKLVVIGGSSEYIGAIELASSSGYRGGSGYVKAIVPENISSLLNTKLPEVIVENFTTENLEKSIEWADAIVLGPGLKIELRELEFILDKIQELSKPVVIDAGVFPFINSGLSLEKFPERTIFTPHIGELENISLNIKTNFYSDPIHFLDDLIEELNGKYCLIKGQPNFLIHPDGSINLMNHGSPMLATAGTGDVLSGMIGGLLSQGYNEQDAMMIGSWIHAESALIYSENFGSQGMIASDLLDFIPSAFEKYVSHR
jgi:ADP-dependent NAD(P)H-hydrate dehydratase / NAD(P)H-hydrate epimerase